jgi:cysteine-rich repeat protein
MRFTAIFLVVLGTASVVGAGQRFVLTASEDPVPIVDGESTFLLDTVVPTDTETGAYKLSTVNNNETAAFPRFTAAVTEIDVELAPALLATVNLSANTRMNGCADVGVTVARVDATGVVTLLGSQTVTGLDVPAGTSQGTQGFAAFTVNVPLGVDRTIPAGSALAVTVAVTNHCGVSRGVFLAYGSAEAASRVVEPGCGNGFVETGESCDDGNQDHNDACPASCVIAFCFPTTANARIEATVAVPSGALVGGMTAFVDFPEDKLYLSGSGEQALARFSSAPAGSTVSANDLEHAVRWAATTDTPFGSGVVFQATFQRCAGAPSPAAADFTCAVEDAADDAGNPLEGATCSVTVLP